MILKTLYSLIIASLLAVTPCFCEEDEQPEVESKIIVEHEYKGKSYRILSETEGYSGALYILRKDGEDWTAVAGDSSPFPLDQYGIEEKLSLELAKKFVEYEISTMGMAKVSENLSDRKKLPWDLKEAYSAHADVSHIRSVYRAKKKGLNPMVAALKKVENAQGADQLKLVVNKELAPYFHKIIIQIADEPKPELSSALFRALKSHPSLSELQQILAVYAANQERDFLSQVNGLPQEQRRICAEALDAAVMAKLVGSKFSSPLKELVKTIR